MVKFMDMSKTSIDIDRWIKILGSAQYTPAKHYQPIDILNSESVGEAYII